MTDDKAIHVVSPRRDRERLRLGLLFGVILVLLGACVAIFTELRSSPTPTDTVVTNSN